MAVGGSNGTNTEIILVSGLEFGYQTTTKPTTAMGTKNKLARQFLLKIWGGNQPTAEQAAEFSAILGAEGGTSGFVPSVADPNVATGSLGETLTGDLLVGAATALVTATPKTVISVELTPGVWSVSGKVAFVLTGATQTEASAGIHTVTNVLPTDNSVVFSGIQTTTATTTNGISVAPKTVAVTENTTIYLVASSTFSAGTEAAFGQIKAVRVG